jgi:iron(III) transport system substrate-binding protein
MLTKKLGGSMKRLIVSMLTVFTLSAQAAELNIYSVYPEEALGKVMEAFSARTGVKVNLIVGTSGELIEKLKTEGNNTTADLHIDKDLVYHAQAKRLGLYSEINSNFLNKTIPKNFFDVNKTWFTVFYRARVMMYNSRTVNPNELSSFKDLADPKWEGRLCVRTSKSSYNEALTAYFLHHLGAETTKSLLSGIVANLAVDPTKNDRAMIEMIDAGVCDVGIANTYYLAPYIVKNPNFAVKVAFAKDTMAHVNGVGIGLVKASQNKKIATQFMEFMASTEVQGPLAQAFYQYPVNKNAVVESTISAFGRFQADTTSVDTIGGYVEAAKKVLKEVEYK